MNVEKPTNETPSDVSVSTETTRSLVFNETDQRWYEVDIVNEECLRMRPVHTTAERK